MTIPLAPPRLDLPLVPAASGTVRLPGSKSISNRALLLAALAEGETVLLDLLQSDDTAVMLDSLTKLGMDVTQTATACRITGKGGNFPRLTADLHVGNSGLSMRTLVPVLVAALNGKEGRITLSGTPRMHERPIGDLVEGLRQLGADIRYLGQEGYPPLALHGKKLTATTLRVAGATSSQFLTGLLQMAPLVARDQPLEIAVEGELISKPYVEMTLAMMARFGVTVERDGWQRFIIAPGQNYRAIPSLPVEGDASSASYFLAAGAITGGPVRVEGVGQASLQGDVRFADALALMGATITKGENWIEASRPAGKPLQALTLDCNAIPDAAMTLAVTALFAKGTTKLTGIGSWRVKETDRLAAMSIELKKLGAGVEEGLDWIAITPPTTFIPADIFTYDDHRMAMCFALATLGGTSLTILNPDCVAKTFPGYWKAFASITGA